MEKTNALIYRMKNEASRQRRMQLNAIGENKEFVSWVHREIAEALERLIGEED